ncbi:MAG TPA: RluA family pseudouridine synthase [Candidatus Paceibacterota bacterium]
MQPEIIYEDESIVAVNKPSGLLVHPASSTERPDAISKEETLSDWVLAKYPGTAEVGEPIILKTGEIIKRPGIVHRLDKETSGVILIAKTEEAFQHLKSQFKNRQIEKTYRAFVWGNFKELEGEINKPIGRSVSDFRKKSAGRGATGLQREALTLYKVIAQNNENAYLEVYPKTGRTHQIRVHLQSISRPVVGDTLYAPKLPLALGFERLALHALSVKFLDLSGKEISVLAPLPQDFKEAEACFLDNK